MRKIFDYCLIFVTVTPIIFIVAEKTGAYQDYLLAAAMTTLANTHVFATTYLFSDSKVREFVMADRIRFLLVPVLIMIASIAALQYSPLWVSFGFILFYIHYQAYHYGKQNLGIASFSSIGSRRIGVSAFERHTIQLGMLCGVMGAYMALAPELMIRKHYGFDLSLTDRVFRPLALASSYLYAVVLVAAIYHAIANLRQWPRYAVLYLLSVAFFVPSYMSGSPYVTFLSYATAHGLQYLVFLSFHAKGSVDKKGFILPIMFLLLAVATGDWLWNNIYFLVGIVDTSQVLIKIALGIIFGLTLVHFWFDQNLWKLSRSDRREWMRDRYAFLFVADRPSNRIA